MDRLFEESFVRPGRWLSGLAGEAQPALDMYQTANDLVVEVSLPGVRAEDVDISITGDVLTIKGESKMEEEVRQEDYLLQERRYGSFSRSVSLPIPVKADKAQATFKQGVLVITIPKAEAVRPTQIKIRGGGG
jgi:HSP20 family protein